MEDNCDVGHIHSHVEMSKEIGELALALSKAQAKLGSIHKGEKGFGYFYANLASTIEAAKDALSENELAVTQLIGKVDMENKTGTVTTILLHSSGQFIKTESSIPLIEMKGTNDAQNFGAISSYLRRYALQAILNMASEDNDASSKGKADTSKYKKPAEKKAAVKEESESAPKKPRFRKKKVEEEF